MPSPGYVIRNWGTRAQDISNYIVHGVLWDAFVSEERCVVLIDEIDKADIEFPNDLLQELDRMAFEVYETRETVKARRRPLVIITSNKEKGITRRLSATLFLSRHQLP